jgi:hypothetical protein
MSLGVYCECGKTHPVADDDAGSTLVCSCGRRVVVPLLEEFRERPLLLSAATVERRVQRLIAAGELPDTDACLRCGDGRVQVVNAELECERCKARRYGGRKFLIIPFLWGFYFRTWREEEGVEIQGRDTVVPAPVALCGACRDQLRAPRWSLYLLLAALLLAVSGVVGYFEIIWGVGTVAVGLALLALLRRFAWRGWQRALKAQLRKVPVYRQVLERYPWAVVVLPKAGSGGPADAGGESGFSSTSRTRRST